MSHNNQQDRSFDRIFRYLEGFQNQPIRGIEDEKHREQPRSRIKIKKNETAN